MNESDETSDSIVMEAEMDPCMAEDIAWLQSDDDGPAFAFVTVCQRLGIDPAWIRRLVRSRRALRAPLEAEAA